MSDHPFVFPPKDAMQNSVSFKEGDTVRIDDPTMDIERYLITEVIGEDEVAQYAVIGLQTTARFSYFLASELRPA
jgi:hypothetical protein